MAVSFSDTSTLEKIRKYFPDYRPLPEEEAEFAKSAPEYLVSTEEILPYLQTLFFEERVISVQIEQTTRHYSTILWDNLPELIEEEIEGEMVLVAPEYEPGSYLKQHSHLNILPLEPVSGNMLVRNSAYIILFFYAGTTSVEIGVTYQQVTTIRDQQVIQCTFPEVARIIRNNRQYRAKTVKDQDKYVTIVNGKTDLKTSEFPMVDLSANGLAFGSPEPLEQFEESDKISLIVDSHSDEPIEVNAEIRNFNKVRTREGNIYLCGVQFDLETRNLAARIEKKYAALQRAYIRSLNEETEGMDVVLKVQ